MNSSFDKKIIADQNINVNIRTATPKKIEIVLILAHGAGAGMDSPFMRFFQDNLVEKGIKVTEFNFGYIEAGKKAPAPRKKLESEWRAVINYELELLDKNIPIFIGGKSMGGRIASYILPEYPQLSGLVFLGYPLHPPGKPNIQRAEHLYKIQKPMLFISGTKDRLAQLDLLKSVVGKIGSHASLYLVEDGDHSLKVPKRSWKPPEQILTQCCIEIVTWMSSMEQISSNKPLS
jgi:predicted alpha/beta-hydrolase family hydrolase